MPPASRAPAHNGKVPLAIVRRPLPAPCSTANEVIAPEPTTARITAAIGRSRAADQACADAIRRVRANNRARIKPAAIDAHRAAVVPADLEGGLDNGVRPRRGATGSKYFTFRSGLRRAISFLLVRSGCGTQDLSILCRRTVRPACQLRAGKL